MRSRRFVASLFRLLRFRVCQGPDNYYPGTALQCTRFDGHVGRHKANGMHETYGTWEQGTGWTAKEAGARYPGWVRS